MRVSRSWWRVGTDPRFGSLPVLMIALTVVSGAIDAVSVLALGQVFVANMTGNVALLGFGLAGARGFGVLDCFVALIGFIAGAAVFGELAERSGERPVRLVRNATAVQGALMAVCLVLSATLPLADSTPSTLATVAVAAVGMGMQNATARRVGVPDMTTSVVTLTLAGLAAEHRHQDRNAVVRRSSVVLALLLGAGTGALLVVGVGITAGFALVVALLVAISGTAAYRVRREQPPAA